MKYCYIFLILLPFLGFCQVQIGNDIIGSYTENWAGFSVSMNEDGSRMAVGAPKYTNNQGQVKIYEFSGNDWVQLGNTILGEKQFDFAGWDISLSSSGNRIAIGSYTGGTTYSQGQVRIFELNSGVWVQLGNSLNGDDLENYFGQSVSLSGDGNRVVIGAPFNDLNGTVAGQVKVFEFDLNNWIQIGADILGEASQDRSGWDVSINETGNRIAMSAVTNNSGGTGSGHVRIFEFINGNWTLLGQEITGVSAYENSGTSISLDNSGNRIAIGNRLNSEVATASGQVRIYEFSGGSWTQLGRDLNGNAKNDELGSAVSLSSDGNRLAVGAPNATAPDDSIGFVQVFEFLEGDWIPLGENLTGEVVKDEFGKSVGISGNGKRLVVGAPKYKNNVYKVGKVKVYDLNTVRITGISQDTGNSNTDGITKNQELIINGKAEANSIIEIFLNGISIGTTTVNAFGNWSFDYTGTTLEEGVYNLTAQATDTFNNTGPISKVFTIVIDITPPIITFPEDITQENDLNDCGAAITYEVTVNDNNQGATISSIPNSGSRFPLGKTVVNVLGTDVAGNIATNTFNVTVNDNEAPSVIAKNITIPLGANGTITLLPSQINNGSSDNCEIAEITLSKTTFDCSNIGDNTVVLTVKDANNNEATSSSIVTVMDTIAPTVVTQNLNLQLVAGSITITPEDINNNSSDNCEISSMSLNKTTFDCSNIGENTVTLTVTDTSGNSNSADAIITIDGIQTAFTSNENIVCRNTPVDFTDASIAYGTATISSWNWDFGDGTSSTEQNPTHTFDLPGNYVVSLTITDSNGCQNTFTSTIKINSPKAEFAISPAIGGSTPHTVFFTDQSVLPDIWSWKFGDGSTSTAQNPIHSYTAFGDFTVKLTVTDTIVGCSDFTEKLVKIAKPNSNFTSNTQFGCGPLTVNFEDTSTVSGNDTIESWLWDFGDGTTSTEQNPTHIYENSGTYSVSLKTTLTTTGITNTNSKSNYIQVLGPNVNFTTINETVGCPDLTINFENQTIANSPITLWLWDFGDGTTSTVYNPTHTYTTYGSYDVSLTVTDLDGCSRTLIKQAFVDTSDTIAPTAVCKPFTAALNANGMVTISATDVDGGSTDNCKIALLTVMPNTFTCANIGENTVTLTVTDENGNSTSETAIVTVEDNIAPIALTKDITIQLGENGAASISAEDVDNGSYDACGIKLLSLFPTNQSFDCSNIGENEVKLLVVDNSDNVTAAYATVTVVDTTAPTVSTQNITVQLDANGTASITVEDINNGSSDNCEIETFVLDTTTFDCTSVGENTVTLTVTDVNGNSANATAVVSVEDNIAPIVSTQNITVQLDANGTASTAVDDINNGSSDNCGIESIVLDTTTFDCTAVGENIVTLTVTDVNGNSANATAVVSVEDNIAPIVSTQNIPVQLDANGTASIAVDDINNGSSDNCGIESIVLDTTTFDCTAVGENIVTLTVTDVNGNSANATAVVSVEDNIAPIVSTQNITVQLDANGTASITVDDINNGSSDNCGIGSIVLDTTTFNCTAVGENTVKLTVTDVNRNTTTATAVVTVEDIIAPIASCSAPFTIQLDETGSATITVDDINNDSSDNCEIASLSIDQTDFNCDNLGENTVTLTVTDTRGNTNVCTTIVTVEDTTVPIVITQNISVELDENGNATISAEDINDGSFDACGIATLSLDQTTFSCPTLGNTTVTLTVVDNNGNSASEIAIVTFTANDLDNDGIADVCDDDLDGDGVDNDIDNCPTVANPNQADIDRNGIGDVCDQGELEIPKGFSPNGDGVNDEFIIAGLHKYPNNSIQIYNRYGNMVYESNNYQNYWDGVSSGKTRKLPAAPYFYVLSINGGTQIVKGWLYINY